MIKIITIIFTFET